MTDRIFRAKQVLIVEREISVRAASRAAAGRLLRAEMDVLLDNSRQLDEFLIVSGSHDEAGDVSFESPRVRDWQLDTGIALRPVDGNGPRPQRIAELLEEAGS